MLTHLVAAVVASAALVSAAPQAVSSPATTGTVTAAAYVGNTTRNTFPPSGSKYVHVSGM